MVWMRISDVVATTGFSATTIRFYEDNGVVPRPPRTASGYRMYDERSVTRLGFVARAKRFGLSLDEISELVRLWDGDECGPVQERLQQLLHRKQQETRRQTAELSAFAHELDGIARRLGRHTPEGPCDETCGCVQHRADDSVPIACSLDARERPERLARWRELLADVDHEVPIE